MGAADSLFLHLDVFGNESIAEVGGKVKRRHGAIDLLINNAGIGVFIAFKKQTVKDIEGQIRTNLDGLIKVTRAFLPRVRKAIINIASAAGKTAYEEMSVYCGSKFGVRGFTQTLALESPRLRIFCVNPDMTATRLSGHQGRPPQEVAEVIFRVVSGQVRCRQGGGVDVWEAMG